MVIFKLSRSPSDALAAAIIRRRRVLALVAAVLRLGHAYAPGSTVVLLVGGVGVVVGKALVQPLELGRGHLGRPPVETWAQRQHCRHQHRPHNEGVHQDAEDQAEAHLVRHWHASDQLATKGEGHDQACGRDDRARDCEAQLDRLPVTEALLPVLPHPGEEEDVVVQRQTQHERGGQHEDRPMYPSCAHWHQAFTVCPLKCSILVDVEGSAIGPSDGQDDGEEHLHGYEGRAERDSNDKEANHGAREQGNLAPEASQLDGVHHGARRREGREGQARKFFPGDQRDVLQRPPYMADQVEGLRAKGVQAGVQDGQHGVVLLVHQLVPQHL
mmetsp:Transcript_41405/g.88239  ORF Transcript_41405/g.88239 Transcript_41405/m.88239 type:complete len:328 (+) Transcript_41405:106-1089(+)